MTVIDHSHVVHRHVCALPAIREFVFEPVELAADGAEFGPAAPPTVLVHHPEGTRVTCSCGMRWTVWRRPTERGSGVIRPGGLEWRVGSRLAAWWRRRRG